MLFLFIISSLFLPHLYNADMTHVLTWPLTNNIENLKTCF